MSVTWLLDNQCFDEALPELKDELTRHRTKYINARYRGFDTPIEIESVFPSGNVFCYGSLPFINKVKKEIIPNNPQVHAWCNLPQFKCSYYYPRLAPYMLNKEYCLLPYAELTRNEDMIFRNFGIDDCIFMRPNSGYKEFTGQVYQRKYWNSIVLSNVECRPEDLVLITTPKNIVEEYRVVIGPSYNEPLQRIVTLSRSHVNRKLAPAVQDAFESRWLVDFVHEVLYNTHYEPDPFWVMDVARTSYTEYKILEVNSMSCSGLYCCNLKDLVRDIDSYFAADNIMGYKK